MYPKLFSIGPFTLHTYGLFIAVGFFAAMALAVREGRRYGLSKEFLMDLCMWTIIGGLAGARVLYVITRWKDFSSAPLEMFKIWNGGIVWYGGMIAGTFVVIFTARRKKIPILQLVDVITPAAALGNGIGRLGCLAAGCCYGRVTTVPWGIVFNNPEGLARPLGQPLHPTQIYMFLADMITCGVLLFVRRKYKDPLKDPAPRHGIIFAMYMMMYAVGRAVIEAYRDDAIRGFVVENMISTSQFIAIFGFMAGLVLFVYIMRKSRGAARAA